MQNTVLRLASFSQSKKHVFKFGFVVENEKYTFFKFVSFLKNKPTHVFVEALPKKFFGSSLDARSQKQNFVEYTLQVAATTSKRKANKMVMKLKKKGVKGLYILQTAKRGGGNWYKLRVGSFANQQKAKEMGSKLVGEKIIQNYFVIAVRK